MVDKGSFEGLYTFFEVGIIYGFDASNLRKQVSREKLIKGKDIKKFGKTWVITEQSMVKHFGNLKLEEYKTKSKQEKVVQKKLNAKKTKVQSSRTSKKSKKKKKKEEKINNSWVNGDIKGVEVKSFAFNKR